MDTEAVRTHCMSLPGTTETVQWGNDLVFKVGGKAFLLTGLGAKPLQFNVKCDPETAVALRERHASVLPGYHMNKKHWNTVIADGSAGRQLLEEWIDHSYELVVKGLPKAERKKLAI